MEVWRVTGYKYNMDRSGVADICKSKKVKDELENIAENLCAQANAQESSRQGHAGYKTDLKTLTFTAIDVIYPGDRAARSDNATHHTLDALNH